MNENKNKSNVKLAYQQLHLYKSKHYYIWLYDFDLCRTNIVTVFLKKKKNHILQNKTRKTFT